MEQTIKTISEAETEAAAIRLADGLKAGDVVLLRGPLGCGKTVFARALIRALAGDSRLDVPSPTFTLAQTYETERGTVWHFDLYRLEDTDEVYEVGWEEALSGGIVLVEWPERLGSLAPQKAIEVTIEGSGDGARQLVVKDGR